MKTIKRQPTLLRQDGSIDGTHEGSIEMPAAKCSPLILAFVVLATAVPLVAEPEPPALGAA